MPSKRKVLIIGSGVAGMACATRLAVYGFDVTVFEKNSHPGGKLHVLEKDGYTFDGGPSLFVQPHNIEALFKLAGEKTADFFQYRAVESTCKYFYEDGIVINAYSNKEKFAQELETQTGEPSKHLIAYLDNAEKLYNRIGEIFTNQSIHKPSTFLQMKILKALLTVRPALIFSSLNKFNKKKFNSTHVVQLFNRYATYSGSDPFLAPAMLQLAAHPEMNEGVFYPAGGMISINRALYQLALKKGVQFYFNSPVERIVKDSNNVKGVIVNGQEIPADIIISNVDVYFTYLNLLNDTAEANKILQQERSSSALIFYWGIKKEFPQLDLHNIFFSNNYEAEFESIFKTKKPYDDPTVYINITSKCEPGIHAPLYKENWFVMVNVPADKSMSTDAVIGLYKKAILEKLSRMLKTDVGILIETEAIWHPLKIEADTASSCGAIYGTSSNSWKAAFLRHPNFSKKVHGLYFAGGTVHPGGGIPLCLKSAAITSNLILHAEE